MSISKNELERLMYVESLLLVKNKLRRADLIERFGISGKTATLLIKTYHEYCPNQMILDQKPVRPLYIKSKKCKPCLFRNIKDAENYLKYSFLINEITQKIDI